MTLYQASLFDTPPEPVLAESSGWITGLLSGPLAMSLCVIAVALLGMLMLTGRLPLRRGQQVIMGCFLLLASAELAGTLEVLGEDPTLAKSYAIPQMQPRPSLTPISTDPYAGASLRRR